MWNEASKIPKTAFVQPLPIRWEWAERRDRRWYAAFDNRFEDARTRAAVALNDAGMSELATAVRTFQFRDLRAKTGTDKADATDICSAQQQQLGYKNLKTTEIYVRSRVGEKVTPTK